MRLELQLKLLQTPPVFLRYGQEDIFCATSYLPYQHMLTHSRSCLPIVVLLLSI